MSTNETKQEFNLSDISNENSQADFKVQNKQEEKPAEKIENNPQAKQAAVEARQASMPIHVLETNEEISKSKMFTIALALIALFFVFGTGFIIFKYFQNYLGNAQEKPTEIAVVDVGNSTKKSNDVFTTDYDGIEVSGITPAKPEVTVTPQPTPEIKPTIDNSVINPKLVEKNVKPVIAKTNAAFKNRWVANNYKIGDIKAGSYKIVSGDTLWEIAEATYGDGSMWTKIASANNIGTSPHGYPSITPGMTITIP